MATQLKASFAQEKKYEAFYTGGRVQISSDGQQLFCQCGQFIQVLEVDTGQLQKSIGQDDDEVTCFCLSPDDNILVVAGQSLLLKQWAWRENTVTRTWKAIHTGPVTSMTFDPTSTLLATGGSDSTIKVWDVIRQYCTHNLRGHQGIISAVEFHPDMSLLHLYSAGEDYSIRVWDLKTSTCIAVLESHFSAVTSLQFTSDASRLFSAGRDNVVTVWNTKSHQKEKTLPVYESVEALILLPSDSDLPQLGVADSSHQYFITAGSKGVLKVWDTVTAQCVFSQTKSDSGEDAQPQEQQGQHSITSAFCCKSRETVVMVTHEHNILLHKLQDLALEKQFVGYNDEVIDVKFMGPNDSHIAVATNSSLLKVFDVASWSCQILHGHTDLILALDVSKDGRWLVSGAKDSNVLVWHMDDTGTVNQVAAGHGHTHAVSAVAFPRLKHSFVATGSQDCTIKCWPLPSDPEVKDGVTTLHAKVTEKAHDKDINSIVIAPNDKFIATGSQDKTAKLWSSSDLSLLGVFRGHKRGIWCVQFSPVDQCLVTSSADGTIKIWALSDFSCLKTFEGHESSVLKVSFVTRGMQLLSSGSDGLLKLWTIKTNECVKTIDAHDEKIWALAVNNKEEMVVTGAGDSNLIFWKDVTQTEQEETRAKQEEFILKEQELSNLLQQKKYLKAIALAITLEQPFRVLSIMKEVLNENKGEDQLEKTLLKLRQDQIDAILRFCSHWNTNSRHCHVAQLVLSVLLKHQTPEELMELPNLKASLEAILPYTERHFARMKRLVQQATFVDYTWQTMRPVGMEQSAEEENEAGFESIIPSKKDNRKEINSESDSDSETDSEIESVSATKVSKQDILKGSRRKSKSDSDSESDSESESAGAINVSKNAMKHKNESDSGTDSDSGSDTETTQNRGIIKKQKDGPVKRKDSPPKKIKSPLTGVRTKHIDNDQENVIGDTESPGKDKKKVKKLKEQNEFSPVKDSYPKKKQKTPKKRNLGKGSTPVSNKKAKLATRGSR